MDALYTQFDSVFFEKTRLSIITVLYREQESSFTHIKRMFALSDGAAYAHLRKLSQAGYVDTKRRLGADRAETWYSLTGKGREMFRSYLNFLESMTGMEVTKDPST